MGFFDFVKKLNPFRSKAAAAPSATEKRLDKLSKFQRMVHESSPLTQLAAPLPTWSEQQLASLTSETLEQPRDLLDAFLHFGEWIQTTHSSNVAEIHYDIDSGALQIRFKNGGLYQYEDVSIREAESFARASSRGKWVWDNLRKRGTVFGYNRAHPYTFLSGMSDYQPQWMRSEMVRKLHGRVPDSGAQNKSIFKRLMPKRGSFAGKQH